LGFEPAEADIMQKPPRPTNQPILSLLVIWRIIFVSILLVCSVFGLFIFLRRVGGVDLDTARTAAINMIVLGEIVYLINCRKIYNSACNIKGLIENKIALIAIIATLILQLLLTYVPIMQHFFGTKPISLWQWLYIIVIAIILFAMVELEKAVMRFRATKFIGVKK
jgi:magnesium-transporting ATPase (P-type)